MQWQEIIEFLGGVSVFGAVIAYLGKVAIDAYVSGRVEAYKGQLQHAATEHSVRFQSLHTQRAEVIRDFYALLAKLDEALATTLSPFQVAGDDPLTEKVVALSEHFNQTREYFVPRRIFFEESTCQLVDKTLGIARGIFFNITAYEVDPKQERYRYNPEVLQIRHEFWEKARAAHKGDFAELKSKMESEFRAMLGLPNA